MAQEFDDTKLQSLSEKYDKFFDYVKLKANLIGLYSSQTVRNECKTPAQPSQQCYAGPVQALRGLPVRDPYRFGRGRCSGPAWANGTGLIKFLILSRNQK